MAAAVSLTVSVAALGVICAVFQGNALVYGIGTSLLTGVIASFLVAVIIQIRQDKDAFEKKQAALFDAGFYLTQFKDKYRKQRQADEKLDEQWEPLFRLCEKPAKYLCGVYKNGIEVLDVVDISILRKINSSYNIVSYLAGAIQDNAEDDAFLLDPDDISRATDTVKREITELKENIFYLYIKWKKDSVIS